MDHLELAKTVLPHRLVLKMLPRRAAELYLDDHLPELEGEDREYALSFAGKAIPPKQPPKPQDPLFCSAMFLAGVSLGDLAMLFGIQRQTVQQKIARRINRDERQTMRDQLQAMDLEVLALCRDIFNTALKENPLCWEAYHPLEIGRALISGANAIIARDRGEEPLTSRPRRYSNMNISQPTAAEIIEQVKPELIEDQDGAPLPDKFQPNTVRPEEQDFLDTL